jgi:hypothetical protein
MIWALRRRKYASGQLRHFGDAHVTSALTLIATEARTLSSAVSHRGDVAKDEARQACACVDIRQGILGTLRKLVKPILYLPQASVSAAVIQVAARGTGCTNRAHNFVADLHNHATAKKDEVRQLSERSDRVVL